MKSRTHFVARLFAALAVTFALLSSATPAAAEPVEDAAALTLINQTRATYGICPLVVDVNIDPVAKGWSGFMAGSNMLAHNRAGFTARTFAAENVGYGPSLDYVHSLFVQSPTHFANLTNDRFTAVGIGVAHNGPYTWVTYDFVSADNLPHRC